MDRSDSAAQALAFERTCIESFIHHCATIMLVDNSQNLACVVQQLVKKFEACFTASSASAVKFDMITRRSNSSIARHLCEILEDIWKSQVSSAQNFVMDGLGKLLRGANISSSPGHS